MGKIIKFRTSELYDRVVDEYDIFENSYDFMVFLAVVGYREKNPRRKNYAGSGEDESSGEIGFENVYRRDLYKTIMACLAFQDSGDPEALIDREKQRKVLAQYASGGLEVAEAEFGDVAGDPTDAIVSYIKEHQDTGSDVGGELGKIVESFDDQIMKLEQD